MEVVGAPLTSSHRGCIRRKDLSGSRTTRVEGTGHKDGAAERSTVGPGARALTRGLGLHPEPEFLIIGAQKGGTTSLYEYLVKHPQVRAARWKEIHYFDRFEERGWNWYRSQFPVSARRAGLVTGEATPYYLFHPEIPGRVAAALP